MSKIPKKKDDKISIETTDKDKKEIKKSYSKKIMESTISLAAAVLLGNVFAGLLCDKIPSRFVLAIGQGTIGLSIFWVLFVLSEPWQAFVYGGLIGLALGINMTTNNVIWANYFGRAHLGSIRGMATTAMVISSAIGPLPFGVLSDLMGSHDMGLLALLILPGVSVIASFCAVPPVRGIVMKS